MSTDEEVAKDIVGTLRDGQKGYDSAVEHLGDEAPPPVLNNLRQISAQRGQFADDIVALGAAYGDDVREDGSVAAAFHRGWMAVKDAVTGTDMGAVVKVCIDGDEHAVETYNEAMGKDISPEFRQMLEGQLSAISSNLETLKSHA